MRDFVIHVHQDRGVKRMSGQPRIVRLPETDGDVLQPEITHPIVQGPQIFRHDIFCNYAPIGSDNRCQSHDVVAAACADVRDGHPGLDAEKPHELARFVGGVSLLFAMPNRADDLRDRTFGFRKGLGRCARWRHEVLGGAPHGKCGGEGKRNCNSQRAVNGEYGHTPSNVDCHLRHPPMGSCPLQCREEYHASKSRPRILKCPDVGPPSCPLLGVLPPRFQ